MDQELSLQIKEQSPNKCLLQDTYIENHYSAVMNDQDSEGAQALLELQSVLKSQNLLLEYEEKRKNERMKEIEYVYTNGFNNYLWEKNRNKNLGPMVIINRKDMLQLEESFPEELQIFRKSVLKIDMTKIFPMDTKPNQTFLRDFNNFYPRWSEHISSIIKMQIDNAVLIENAFESEYTFPAKVLSSLKFSTNIQIFCREIFTKPLKEIINYNQELNLDFHQIYEQWHKKIQKSVQFITLSRFLTQDGNPDARNTKKLKQEISSLSGVSLAEADKLIGEMVYFSQNKTAIKHLFEEIGQEEIDTATINIRLAALVWKKVLDHRRKIQSILTAFIDEILRSYSIFPREVKFVMREYYRLAKEKFGEVKYEDVKSFFNKVVFSQLLLPEFMRLLDEQNGVQKIVKDFNIPILALFSQKILYGQEFYEKQKYSYFNQLTTYYSSQIKQFMTNFLDQTSFRIHEKVEREIEPMLISFEGIKFLYEYMRKAEAVKQLPTFETKICKKNQFEFGSSKYKQKNVYIIFINGHDRNYQAVFKPKQKIKRIFIEFLMLIEKIPQAVSLPMLLQQYKHAASHSETHSVQIHANYLSLIQKQVEISQLCSQIREDIKNVKKICERTKIELQKQYNMAQNIEKVHMKNLKEKQKFSAFITIKDFITSLLDAPAGFHYGLFDGKVCEVEGDDRPQNSLTKCLSDIAEYYLKDYEGYDALFHLLLQKINEQVEGQGIVDEETCEAAKNIIGAKLYELVRLSTTSTEKDRKILQQMNKHSFITLEILELPQYNEEEQLIIELSLPILQKLKTPQSPEQLLNIFYDVTNIFQNIILTTGKSSDITADVQIPMMIMILTKSKLPNLSSILRFIQKFCSDDINSSVLGQTHTLISSVCYLIQQMGPKQLNMGKQKYDELCEEEYQRMKAEHDRQYLIIDGE